MARTLERAPGGLLGVFGLGWPSAQWRSSLKSLVLAWMSGVLMVAAVLSSCRSAAGGGVV